MVGLKDSFTDADRQNETKKWKMVGVTIKHLKYFFAFLSGKGKENNVGYLNVIYHY